MLTRSRWILVIFVAGSLSVAAALTYKRWPHLLTKGNKQGSTTAGTPDELSSVPPFSTKEPERYQATRIITSVEYTEGSASAPVTVSTKFQIARDGDSRREEYDNGTNGTVVYLETAQGRFILLPAKKLYADLNSAGDVASPRSRDPAPSDIPDLSPDRLLHETRALARYEKLGAEKINERATTKFRVTSGNVSADGNGAGGVTLIWIDDALAVPVRSETKSTAGGHTTTVTAELQNLKQIVDPLVFALPKDYLKVDYRRLYSELPPTARIADEEKAKP